MTRLPPASALLALVLALPALAGTPIDQSRPASPDVHLRIENIAGRVEVRPGSSATVRVTGELGDGSLPLVFEGEPGRLTLRVEPEERGGWGNRMDASELVVTMPAGGRLEVNTVSADIDVAGIDGSDVELESVSGSVAYTGGAGRVHLKSVSGSVEGAGAGRDWTIGTVSGRITLPQAAGSLRVESVSGRIELDFAAAERAQLETVSGSIVARGQLAGGGSLAMQSVSGALDLQLSGALDARIRAKTFSGRIETDVGTPQSSGIGGGNTLDARAGSGGGDIRLESFSGRIRIRTGAQ
jgi:DUF4097 and DUF4098 domain-containing protein YvlB